MIGLYKAELIRRHGPWRTPQQVELATVAYIDWFNNRWLYGELGHVHPPSTKPPTMQVWVSRPSPECNDAALYRTRGGSLRGNQAAAPLRLAVMRRTAGCRTAVTTIAVMSETLPLAEIKAHLSEIVDRI